MENLALASQISCYTEHCFRICIWALSWLYQANVTCPQTFNKCRELVHNISLRSIVNTIHYMHSFCGLSLLNDYFRCNSSQLVTKLNKWTKPNLTYYTMGLPQNKETQIPFYYVYILIFNIFYVNPSRFATIKKVNTATYVN